jgi:pimeloyl-[acyl-carrier protein] methyl ester esterase
MTPPLPDALFLTGWGHGADSLASLRAALSMSANAPMLSPADLDHGGPGAGSSCAEELLSRLRERGRPAPVIAWSMGAVLALEAAALAPGQIRALVLLAPTARFCAGASYRAGIRELALRHMIARLETQPRETLREFFCNAARPEDLAEGALNDAVQQGLAIPAPVLARGLEYLRHTDLRDRLARVQVPALVIHGDKDGIVPCEASEIVAGRLSAVTREVLPGAGHMLPQFHLDRVGELIIKFLLTLS